MSMTWGFKSLNVTRQFFVYIDQARGRRYAFLYTETETMRLPRPMIRVLSKDYHFHIFNLTLLCPFPDVFRWRINCCPVSFRESKIVELQENTKKIIKMIQMKVLYYKSLPS
jgi:hypothetical protein